jgi:hypothetical protein
MTFNKPADNVGIKSFGGAAGDYATYAKNFIYSNVDIGCTAGKAQFFVGQRAESFAVNLGPIFDLIDAPPAIVTGGGTSANYAAVPNPIASKNVTSIAIEVPAACITQSATQPIIGAWTTAALPQARVLNPASTYALPSYEGGALTEVSRLGNPLVNEVVIGLPAKDLWNNSEPSADVANFANYVEYPTLPAIIDVVFSTDFQPTTFPRTDLVEAFLTGVAPVNAFPTPDGGKAPVPADTVKLNTNTEGLLAVLGVTGKTPTPAGSQNRLGAAGCVVAGAIAPSTLTPYAPATSCDPFGFPNGRRPIDDVVDIALDVAEGYLLTSGNPAYSGCPATAAHCVFFTDGVDQAATSFLGDPAPHTSSALPTFPYLDTPTQGANGNGT